MIRDGHLGVAEVFGIMFIIVGTKAFLSFPQSLALDGHGAAWLILIISGLLALAALKLLYYLRRPFQDIGFPGIVDLTLGPYLGVALNVLFATQIIFLVALRLRHYADAVITAFLPETPISVVAGCLAAGIAYLAYSGLETIGRTALFFLPWILGGILLIILGVANWYEPAALFPLLGPGPGQLLYQGVLRASTAFEILVFFLIMPLTQLTRKAADSYRAAVTGLVTVFLALTVVQVTYAMTFPYPLGSNESLPLLRMARAIYWGRLFQHLEPIFLFVWVFSAITDLSASLYAASRVTAGGLKLPVYRPLIFPLILLAFALSFLPPTQPMAFYWDAEMLGSYGIIPAFVIPAAILALARWRKLPGKTGEAPSGEAPSG